MSEIAFNLSGEPFDPPPATAAWRVRKLKPKGAPDVVYGRDGLPLFLPLDADIEELRREVMPPSDGRYRLDPVDEHNRPLPGAQASYVCVHPVEHTPEPAAPTAVAAAIQADTTTQLINALLESQKQHTELARMYVAQFPVLVNALSGVVRSAGDAGLPARVPLVVPVAPEVKPPEPPVGAKDDQDEDDDQEEDQDDEEVEIVEAASEPEWNWPRFAASALDKFGPAIESLVGQLPALGATLGARRAKRAAGEPIEPASGGPATDVAAHLNAIRAALTSEEAAAAMALANELSMTDKFLYFQKLRGMPVLDAVAYVRGELAKLARNSAHGAAGPDPDEQAAPSVAMSDDEIDAHIGAVRAAMTPEESETVRVMFEELVFEHRLIWVEKLCRMSVPEGVAFLRQKLAEAQHGARARGAAEPRIMRMPSAAPSSVTPDAARAPRTAQRPSAPVKPRRDGRRVVGSPPPLASPPATSTAPSGGGPTAGLGMVSPTTQAHIAAIQAVLTPDEDAAVRAYLAALPQPERSAWIAALLTLPVSEAIAMIRAQRAAGRLSVEPDHTMTAAEAAATAMDPQPRNLAALASATMPEVSVSAVTPREAPSAPLLTMSEPPVITEVAALHEAPSTPVSAMSATSVAADAAEVRAPHEERSAALPVPSPHAAPTIPSTPADVAQPAAAPVLDTNADRHLLAIEHALSDGERFLVHAMVARMSPDGREILLDKLLSVSVPEGAAILRAAIQELTAQALPVEPRTDGIPDARERMPSDAPELGEEEQSEDEELEDDQQLEDDDQLEDDQLEHDQLEHDQPEHAHSDEGPVPSDSASGRGTAPAVLATPTAVSSAGLPMLDPEASAHFAAINAALTFAERLRVFELGAQLSPSELRGWIAALMPLSVPEAVATIRAALAKADSATHKATKGGVS